MKRLFILVIVSLFSLSSLSANGLFITPGVRANAMGSAYVAIADDITAIYYNPAGLSQIKTSKVETSFLYCSGKSKSNQSLQNSFLPDINSGDFPLPMVYPTEPTQFNNKTLDVICLAPFIAGCIDLKEIQLAIGAYLVGGGGGKWEDNLEIGNDSLHAILDGSYGFIIYNISVAKQINSELSLGAGINFVTMQDQNKIKKEYIASTDSLLPSYLISLENNATGSGLEFSGGALYKPIEKLRTGLIIRSGTNIKLSGNSKFSMTGSPEFETNYDQNYSYPLTFDIGAAYDYSKKLTIACAFDWNNYSTIKKDIDYENELPGTFEDINEKQDFNNTIRMHLGLEYRYKPSLCLWSGIQYDPGLTSKNTETFLTTEQYDLTTIGIGAGYSIGKLQLDIAYSHCFSNKIDKNGKSFEYPVDNIQLGIGYKFN